MIAAGPHQHIMAPCVHAFEPGYGAYEFFLIPRLLCRLPGFSFMQHDVKLRHAQRRYLFFERLKASITAGFKYCATCLASS